MKTILDTIGNTPLVKLDKLASNTKVAIFAKLEGANPSGSVKDRPAYWMIKKAKERGDLLPGTTLVEGTPVLRWP